MTINRHIIILWRKSTPNIEILVEKAGDKFSFINGPVIDDDIFVSAYKTIFNSTDIWTCDLDSDLRYVESLKEGSVITHVFWGEYDLLPDINEKEFNFIGESEIDLMQDYHKQIAINFFNYMAKKSEDCRNIKLKFTIKRFYKFFATKNNCFLLRAN